MSGIGEACLGFCQGGQEGKERAQTNNSTAKAEQIEGGNMCYS